MSIKSNFSRNFRNSNDLSHDLFADKVTHFDTTEHIQYYRHLLEWISVPPLVILTHEIHLKFATNSEVITYQSYYSDNLQISHQNLNYALSLLGFSFLKFEFIISSTLISLITFVASIVLDIDQF